MIEYCYEEKLWDIAKKRALEMTIYEGSHRGFAANEVGALGEVVFEHFLSTHGIPFARRYTTTEDLAIFGATVDVKTKDRTVIPEASHDCSVPLYNHEHQRPSFYVFVSLYRDRSTAERGMERFSRAYLLGWASIKQVESGRHWPAGAVDPDNGTKFWTACINIPIGKLKPLEVLVERSKKRLGGSLA